MYHKLLIAFMLLVIALSTASSAWARPSQETLRIAAHQQVELTLRSGAVGRGTIIAYNDRAMTFVNDQGEQTEIALDQVEHVRVLAGAQTHDAAVGQKIAIVLDQGIVMKGTVFAVEPGFLLLRHSDGTLQQWKTDQLKDVRTGAEADTLEATDLPEDAMNLYALIRPPQAMIKALLHVPLEIVLDDDTRVQGTIVSHTAKSVGFMDRGGRIYDFPMQKVAKLSSPDRIPQKSQAAAAFDQSACGPQSACLSREMADFVIANMLADRYEQKGAGLRGIGKIMTIAGGIVLAVNIFQWVGYAVHDALANEGITNRFILPDHKPLALTITGVSLIAGGIGFRIAGNAVRRSAIRRAKKNPLYSVSPALYHGGGGMDLRLSF